MGKRERDEKPAAPEGPFNAALARLKERLPEGWSPPPAAEPAPGADAPRQVKGPARAVVRLERKGRAGKEATVVEKLALSPEALRAWSDELKRFAIRAPLSSSRSAAHARRVTHQLQLARSSRRSASSSLTGRRRSALRSRMRFVQCSLLISAQSGMPLKSRDRIA